jgi:hypothetical protein
MCKSFLLLFFQKRSASFLHLCRRSLFHKTYYNAAIRYRALFKVRRSNGESGPEAMQLQAPPSGDNDR